MAYTAPTIKDRVAAGDNKYTMQTLSDGRVLLTPSPDEVEEAGTAINKVLLQPLMDAVAALDTNTLPYTNYWWKRRTSESADWQFISSAASDTYPHSGTSGGYEYEYLGQIFQQVLEPGSPALTTKNITSASYSSDKLTVLVPGNLCLFMIKSSYSTGYDTSNRYMGDAMGIIDKASGKVWYMINEYTYTDRMGGAVHSSGDGAISYYMYQSGSPTTVGIAKYSNGTLLFGWRNVTTAVNRSFVGTVYFLPLA